MWTPLDVLGSIPQGYPPIVLLGVTTLVVAIGTLATDVYFASGPST